MTNRFYFTKVAPGYTGTTNKGNWNATAGGQFKLGLHPDDANSAVANTTAIARTVDTASTGRFLNWARFVSDPAIASGTIAGTMSGVVGLLRNNTSLTAILRFHIWVTQGDSNNVRGTLWTNANTSAVTFPNGTAAGTTIPTISLGSVAIQVGDRLVVEIGYSNTAGTSTGYSASMYHGIAKRADIDGGTVFQPTLAASTNDLASGNAVTIMPGWVDFTGTDGLFNKKMELFVDDFDDNAISSEWGNSYGTYKEEDGMAQVAAANGVYSGYYSIRKWTIRESSMTINLKGVVGPTAAGTQAWCSVTLVAGVTGSALEHFYDADADSMYWRDNADYDDSGQTSLAFTANAANLAWLRIREASNTVYWETSPTGYDQWTQRKSVTTHGWHRYGDMGIIIQAYRNGADTTDYSKWDNLNVIPTAGPTNAQKSGAFLHAA